jgi:hypothetical protein
MAAPTLTTSAYVLHNLGLAAGFGGSLFGKVALNPSARFITDQKERAKVVNAAWNGYNVLNALALGTTAATWFIGRGLISGRSISRRARGLVLAKDLLVGTTLVTGLANLLGGSFLAKKSFNDELPMESGSKAAEDAPAAAKTTTKMVNWLGVVNIACMAGIIGVSTWLDNHAQSSHKWSAVARLLP